MVVAACGGPELPNRDLALEVTVGAEEVALGQGFPVTVRRLWSKNLDPAAWRDDALSPLRLRLENTTVRDDGKRVEEVRRFRAYAFTPSVVTVPPPILRARPRAGGPVREAAAEGFEVRVVESIDPDAPGAPELPESHKPVPPRHRAWWWFAAAVLATGAYIAVRRLRQQPAVPDPDPDPDPGPDWLAQLAALDGETDVHAQVAAIVRAHVTERFEIDASVRTTEELARDVPGLLDVLSPCDLVKFAQHEPGETERADVLTRARNFILSKAS